MNKLQKEMSEKINELYIHEDVILEKLENILSQ